MTEETPNLMEKHRQELEDRAKELEPLVKEYTEISRVLRSIHGVESPKITGRTNGNRGRPRGTGKRGDQVIELVKVHPGITIPDLADAMKIQPNYLYRLLPGLASEGKVRQDKETRGWHVVDAEDGGKTPPATRKRPTKKPAEKK